MILLNSILNGIINKKMNNDNCKSLLLHLLQTMVQESCIAEFGQTVNIENNEIYAGFNCPLTHTPYIGQASNLYEHSTVSLLRDKNIDRLCKKICKN